MLPIRKHPEPTGLRRFKVEVKGKEWPSKKNGPYEEFKGWEYESQRGRAFDQLREQLLSEQHHLCAYCGQYIPAIKKSSGVDLMKTEHFEPQNGRIENDLDYGNLLCVCLGNSAEHTTKPENSTAENVHPLKSSLDKQHCDSSKGDQPLLLIRNPSTISERNREILYKVNAAEGEVLVVTKNPTLKEEITKILNLNHPILRARRFSAWLKMVKSRLPKEPKELNPKMLRELRNEYSQPINGRSIEFKDFILWWLDKEIEQKSK